MVHLRHRHLPPPLPSEWTLAHKRWARVGVTSADAAYDDDDYDDDYGGAGHCGGAWVTRFGDELEMAAREWTRGCVTMVLLLLLLLLLLLILQHVDLSE